MNQGDARDETIAESAWSHGRLNGSAAEFAWRVANAAPVFGKAIGDS